MPGETNLKKLLRSMRPHLHEDTYVFVSINSDQPVEAAIHPIMIFREARGTTLILKRQEAVAQGFDSVFPCRMITLTIHSSLDAVGFMAAITAKLAAAHIGVNPVSGFYHDHLFVPADRAEDALKLLHDLSAASAD